MVGARMDRVAVWPVVAAALAVAVLVLVDGQSSYERPLLLRGLNFVFGTLVSLFIAFWIGRIYLRQCRPGLLLLGCGVLFWGLAGFAGAWFEIKTRITIHNISVWLAAFCHLTGVAISIKLHETTRKPHIWLPIGYFGVVAAVTCITLATTTDRLPLFFLPGQGGTMIRHLVLGSAIAMFVLTAMLLRLMMSRQTEQVFPRWYSLALLLFAVGLVAVSFQKVNGSLLSWTGRAAHYLGGLYMLVAILRSTHGFRQAGMILEQTADGTVPRLGVAAAVAVVSAASAAAARLLFFPDLGSSLSYLTFFPAVILAAFVGGFGSGILTVLLSLLLVFWTESLGLQAFSAQAYDLRESALFLASGLLVALAARTTHRAQSLAILAMAETHRVSERAAAAEALRASEERLAGVIEGTEAGIWDWYVQTGEVVFNERWAGIAGYTLAELAPVSLRTWRDSIHPEDLPKSEAQMAEVFAHTRPFFNIEYRIRHRNGGWVWVQDRGKVMERTEAGNPWRLSGSRTDITTRKGAEAQLVALTRELQAILETVPIGVVKVIERKLVWVNRGMEELLLYPKEDLLFQSSGILYPSRADYDTLGQDAYPLLAQGGVYEAQQWLLRKDGAPMLANLAGRAIDAADPSQGSIWTVVDITERKVLEEAARERAELFTALFEKNKAVQLLIDPRDGAVIDANAAAVVYYGYAAERLKSLNIADINTLSLAEIRQEMARAAKVWGAPFLFRHRLASGELRDVHVFSSPIRIGGRTLFHSIVHDVTERVRLEEELREHQALLHSMTENTSDAIYIKDREGCYLMCNTATARFLGHDTAAPILGRDDRDFYSPDDARWIMAGDRQTLEAEEVRTYEEHVTLGGVAHIFLSTKGPVRNAQGMIVGLFGIARDITERKRMEETLRLREVTLRAIIENQPGLLWLKDADSRFLAVNTMFAQACGRSHPEEVVGRTDFDMWPPDLADRYLADDKAVLQSGKPLVVEELIRDQGIKKWFETFKTPIFNSQGQAIGTTGYSHDITERKRAEHLIRENEERLSAATTAANLGIYSYAFDGSHAYFSPEFLALTGLSAEVVPQMEAEGVMRTIHPDDEADFSARLKAAKDHDGPGILDHDYRIVRPDGEVRWLRIAGRTIFAGSLDGEYPQRAIGIVQDITERKRIEQELQRSRETAVAADAAKSKLLATVAHEFRTPLSLLRSSLDILDRYGERLSEAQRNEQNRYIRSAARQLSNLADTVLTYRTMEKDVWHGKTEPCAIGELCRAIAAETRAAWAGGHDFRVAVGPECGTLLVDTSLFRRVLENLLANAFQYTPPEGTVSLDVRRDGDSLRVVVADQGIGMEAEDRAHVFDSFYRGRNVGQRRGMGLGLSIVRDALHRMNGTIALTSEAGRGTTVAITLPWREADE